MQQCDIYIVHVDLTQDKHNYTCIYVQPRVLNLHAVPPQDVEGWKKLHEVLGSKCLLVADRTFDGLPISPLRKREDKETTEVDETDEGTQGREEAEAEEGLDFLSCVGLSLENTVSATCSRALSLAGELPMYVCIYM